MSQGTFSPIPSSREEWLICFKEENEIRLSSEVQKLYDEGWNCNDLKRITMFVKNQVCNKKGFDPELYIPASMVNFFYFLSKLIKISFFFLGSCSNLWKRP